MEGDESQTSEGLSEEFKKALELYKEVEDSELPCNDYSYQDKVKRAVHLLEKCTEMVNRLGLFSDNETIEDVTTQSVKYLLLPALLGYFSSKLVSKPRKEIVEIAEIYFKDFLRRIKSFQVCPVDFNLEEEESEGDDLSRSSRPDLEQMARDRQRRIEAYKAQKKIQSEFQELESYLEKSKSSENDEKYREYYTLLIKMWVGKAIEELTSIRREKPLLQRLPISPEQQKSSKKTPFKPFIITRTELQKKVYGLGYPALPTMTIEEFAESKIKEGSLSVTDPSQVNSLMEWAKNPDLRRQQEDAEAAEKEIVEEREDVEALKKAREWDEFKDENKRGWGNRYNRS